MLGSSLVVIVFGIGLGLVVVWIEVNVLRVLIVS